jgi:hypothetical protein
LGDRVFDGLGNIETVTHLFTKRAESLVHLHVRGLPAGLTCTPNHLVWAIKGEATRPVEPIRRPLVGGADRPQWIPADFISAGDWVHVPRPAWTHDRPISVELAWLCGLWLAEGSATLDGGRAKRANKITLSMHRRELPILQRAAQIIATEFPDANPPIISTPATRPNSAELVVNGRAIAEWFVERFGRGCDAKTVPDWMLSMAPDLQAHVVNGWFTGDGHRRPDGVRSATTVSPRLAWAMFYMAFHGGDFPSMSLLRAGGPRKRDTYTVHFNAGQEARTEDGQVFYRVQNRYHRPEVGDVYDLEVSGSHTYVVGGVHVHNSLKGWDEYAAVQGFGFEVPQQALAVVSPEHGTTMQAPVFCLDRKAERW